MMEATASLSSNNNKSTTNSTAFGMEATASLSSGLFKQHSHHGSNSLIVLEQQQVDQESTGIIEARGGSSKDNHSTTNSTAIVEATSLLPLNLSADLTELFDATLNVPSSPLIPILNKNRDAEPAKDMIIGNNKKGKQVTDNDVMHIPWKDRDKEGVPYIR
jgi:hypothetical protein